MNKKELQEILIIEDIPQELFALFVDFLKSKKQHYSNNIFKEFAKIQKMYITLKLNHMTKGE